ncbi:hypothetical protein IBX73_00430 [candidate division WOR-3 bacterium]|nr:hypothetical protein [candidate division WOR-3 bacterium]
MSRLLQATKSTKNYAFRDWLCDNSGPIVRYLVARDLARSAKYDLKRLQGVVLESSIVRYWLGCLTGRTGFNDIYGCRDTCFENAMGKLTLFGLRKGVSDLDRCCVPYLAWLEQNTRSRRKDVLFDLSRAIVASFLAMAGYLSERCVRDSVLQRLAAIYYFVKSNDFTIYAEKSGFRGIPVAFRRHPLVNPELYSNHGFPLPWIYDILAFRALRTHLGDGAIDSRVERVISYVLDPRYQQFYEGYGIVRARNNRYYAMGWNVWLPRYRGLHADSPEMGCLVQRLELLSRFHIARSSRWFKENLEMLEGHRNQSGRYAFPKNYIQERQNSYYVTGGHMGLGENRRQRLTREIESTYWMVRIHNNVGTAS